MNILFIKHFFVGFMVSEIHIVPVFGHCPYSGTVRIRCLSPNCEYLFVGFMVSEIPRVSVFG